jgi:hypothetical protein
MHLRDLEKDGDIDARHLAPLYQRMCALLKPVPPLALGVLGEDHLRAWLMRV